MTEQEGAKPHLTIVPSSEADEFDILCGDFTTYGEKTQHIISMLTRRKLDGRAIAVELFLGLLDTNEDNTKVRNWLDDNGVLAKGQFEKSLRRVQHNKRVRETLGFIPSDAVDFVVRYAAENKISLTPNGEIKRARAYKVGQDEVNEHTRTTSRETELIFDVANAEGANIDSLGRELRLLSERLMLGYRDTVISDALQTWQEETRRQQKVDAQLEVQYTKGKATGDAGQAMWAAVEAACFDVTETAPGFPTAVLKKFMWQVKRKARGMSVTNHLMPVITGPQGKGKTQFVLAMTRPLEAFKRDVDFNIITDGKTADIWASWILFIDEMGHFTKSDVDVVKNVITADQRTIRTMRQNNSSPVRNQATLIGCTNKSLAQLIRDDTGGRRFAELLWRMDPDWDALNAADWKMLWQSVDECGPDPVIDGGFMDVLRNQQEANRNQSPIELWAMTFGNHYAKFSLVSEMYEAYREWEKSNFPRHDTNLNLFGRSLSNLLTSIPDFPYEKKGTRRGTEYRYTGGKNV